MDPSTLAVIGSLFFASISDEPAVGALGGQCYLSKSNGYQLCQKSSVWEKYVRGTYHLNQNVNLVNRVSSFSGWDGKADIQGDTVNQSGHFFFVGYGLEWRF